MRTLAATLLVSIAMMPVPASAADETVRVTNGVTNPVPVIVTNPPSQGTNSFIVNPADIAKAEGIQHSFQANLQCGNSASNGFVTFCTGAATLPANQRVVIEYVSLECFVDSTELLRRAIVHTTTTTLFEQGGVGSSGDHTLNIIDHSGAGGDVSIGQPVRFYGDAGTQISVEAQETGSHAGTFLCTASFAGQAIDTP
jgi:hypothetical protein